MENEKLKNGIKEIKEMKMTSFEKSRMLESILGSSIQNEKPVRSTWLVNPFITMVKKNHLAYYVIVPLVITLASGGIVFASNDSLPSSIFYPIKTGIVEPIVGVLQFTPVAKAKYEAGLATKRLVEAETLAGKGKLDDKSEKKLDNLLDNHTEALNQALSSANQKDTNDHVDEIVTNFHADMNAHARILDIINQNNQEENVTSTSVVEGGDSQISQTARENAHNIRDGVVNVSENKSNDYTKKKDEINKLIDIATTDLNKTDTGDGESDVNKTIIEDTHKTIDDAKKYLEEADKKVQEGDSKEAYKNLLDSESSVKEANIFLNTKVENHSQENND